MQDAFTKKEGGQELNQIVEACKCIGLDNVTGYGVDSDYAIVYANVLCHWLCHQLSSLQS
jgi:hypothetical protein